MLSDKPKPTFGFDAFDIANRLLKENTAEHVRPEDFGPYHFLEDKPIGAGALGEVWLAEERGVDRRVAVKILWQLARPDLAAEEVKNQGRLEHPYIARLYNCGQLDDGTSWLAMEYVQGQPLDQYFRERRLSIIQRIRLFRKICEAVEYAHSEMVFHGDLKPANILVKEGSEPKLLDFGLAQSLQRAEDGAENDPEVLGFTPAYAPPEQFVGKSSGFRSDVYSLGTILYELLSGALPFDAANQTLSGIACLKRNEQPKPPSMAGSHSANSNQEIGRAAWRDLDAICIKAMHSVSNLRYSSVEALILDLDRYLNSEPVGAMQPHSRTYLVQKFIRRNRRTLSLAMSMLVAVAGIVALYTVRVAQERNRAIAEAARTRRIQKFMIDLFQNGDPQAAPS
jgi:serine/threonine protein kinase